MGHLSNPDIPVLLAPRSPILVKHRCTCLDFKRNTTMINIKDIGISGESLTGEDMGNSLYNSECKRKSGKELENIISKKLIGLGIPTRLKGYKYMLSAIEQVLEDETSLEGVTKILYPDVAKKYNSTPQRVEKAIRHAIEVAWTDNGVELRREFQDRKENKRPTNSEFISRISAYIKMSA